MVLQRVLLDKVRRKLLASLWAVKSDDVGLMGVAGVLDALVVRDERVLRCQHVALASLVEQTETGARAGDRNRRVFLGVKRSALGISG